MNQLQTRVDLSNYFGYLNVMDLFLFYEHPQWSETFKVYQSIVAQGYTCYFAGGCVRDLCLGVEPKDFDLATNASPKELKQIFDKTIDIGESFGTLILPRKDSANKNFQIEITRFRFDKNYKDGRRPEKVLFMGEEEDALRRDFTMNALFYNPKTKQIIDYVDGEKDIYDKKIRAVGDPYKRFSEDYLRVLRALRFSSQLGFSIEKKTLSAAIVQASEVKKLSCERIKRELCLFFSGDYLLQSLFYFQILDFDKILLGEFETNNSFWRNYKSAVASKTVISLENIIATFVSLSLGQSLDDDQQSLTALQKNRLKLFFSKSILKETQLRLDLINKLMATSLEDKNLPERSEGVVIKSCHKSLSPKSFKLLEQQDVRVFLSLIKSYLDLPTQESLKIFVKEFYDYAGGNLKLPSSFLTAEDIIKNGFQKEKIGELLDVSYLMQIRKQITSRSEALRWLNERCSE